mmetsp:Transcript_12292/g.44823  ORF Transcript_12292/g.44823 Transcript_12292/m.44823 type:complete len:202 (-) Transcript_12292:473-1078(-)
MLLLLLLLLSLLRLRLHLLLGRRGLLSRASHRSCPDFPRLLRRSNTIRLLRTVCSCRSNFGLWRNGAVHNRGRCEVQRCDGHSGYSLARIGTGSRRGGSWRRCRRDCSSRGLRNGYRRLRGYRCWSRLGHSHRCLAVVSVGIVLGLHVAVRVHGRECRRHPILCPPATVRRLPARPSRRGPVAVLKRWRRSGIHGAWGTGA